MSLVSVIIPARNERLLTATVDRLNAYAGAKVEFILVLDGPSEFPIPSARNVRVVRNPEPQGIRAAINSGVSESHGDWLLKLDAHCIVGEDFVKTLLRDCREDQVMVARRFTLDVQSMQPIPRIVDYYYLSCPWTHPSHFMMQSCPWITRTEERMDMAIDDLMCFQGSMWFMSRAHYDWLGGLDTLPEFAEHHEISMKTWLGGRSVKIDKNAWYAHPRVRVSGYRMDMAKVYEDHAASAHFWTENLWPWRQHDFDWLVDRFWPLPTEHNRHRIEKYYWPEDWRKYYDRAL